MLILKHLKKTGELWKLFARKKDDSKISLEMGLLGDIKNSKDER